MIIVGAILACSSGCIARVQRAIAGKSTPLEEMVVTGSRLQLPDRCVGGQIARGVPAGVSDLAVPDRLASTPAGGVAE